jgi:hypothetical protein
LESAPPHRKPPGGYLELVLPHLAAAWCMPFGVLGRSHRWFAVNSRYFTVLVFFAGYLYPGTHPINLYYLPPYPRIPRDGIYSLHFSLGASWPHFSPSLLRTRCALNLARIYRKCMRHMSMSRNPGRVAQQVYYLPRYGTIELSIPFQYRPVYRWDKKKYVV